MNTRMAIPTKENAFRRLTFYTFPRPKSPATEVGILLAAVDVMEIERNGILVEAAGRAPSSHLLAYPRDGVSHSLERLIVEAPSAHPLHPAIEIGRIRISACRAPMRLPPSFGVYSGLMLPNPVPNGSLGFARTTCDRTCAEALIEIRGQCRAIHANENIVRSSNVQPHHI
jgi:hypothetical protein